MRCQSIQSEGRAYSRNYSGWSICSSSLLEISTGVCPDSLNCYHDLFNMASAVFFLDLKGKVRCSQISKTGKQQLTSGRHFLPGIIEEIFPCQLSRNSQFYYQKQKKNRLPYHHVSQTKASTYVLKRFISYTPSHTADSTYTYGITTCISLP